MPTRTASAVVLIMAALVSAHTCPSAAQEIPRDVINVALRHVVGSEPDAYDHTVVVTDHFPNRDVASDAANALGLRAGENSELVQCSDDRRSCRIVGGGKKVIRLQEFHMSRGDEVRLLLVISTQVELPGEDPRLFPELREITLTRSEKGLWKVTGDELLVRG